MKNRPIPFDFKYENGTISICAPEADALKKMCQMYLTGHSLTDICSCLNTEGIEYMPGITGWNKSRVIRLMLDERYLGTEKYPRILDEETVNRIRKIKEDKNTQKEVDRSADIFTLKAPVLCPICGTRMFRRYDHRCECTDRWTCNNSNCRKLIVIADSDLLQQITEILNRIIKFPNQLNPPPELTMPRIGQSARLQNEIERSLMTGIYNKADIRNKMMQCLSLDYKSIDDDIFAIHRMIATFERASLLLSFSADLVEMAVKEIILNTDGTISLTLINGQIIRKENN